jgi:precorrin-3B C17-methyltransferase
VEDGERNTHDGEQAGRSLSTGLNGWMAAIQASGKSAAELAAEYRLPEDYIAAVLASEVPPEGEENAIEG